MKLWKQYPNEAGDQSLADNGHLSILGGDGDARGQVQPAPVEPAALPAPVSGVGVCGDWDGPGRTRPYTQLSPTAGYFCRRSSRLGPLPWVMLGGPPEPLIGRPPVLPPVHSRPRGHSPARARRPPGLLAPTGGPAPSPPRPAPSKPERLASGSFSPPPAAPMWRHFRQRRPPAASQSLANAPGASPEPGARPRMTTNSSRGGGEGVCLSPCLGPRRFLARAPAP